jgi:hypothetical protein
VKLIEDHPPLVLFSSRADVYAAHVAWIRTIAKVAQANIQAILPKFVVSTMRQARQSSSFEKLERIVTIY